VQANARAPLHRLLSCWMLALEQMPGGRAVRWSLDVDPIDLF
jgi:primosomal protein N' (replication factor Y)